MNREQMRERLHSAREPWDVVIVGGGATGLGCALDAASRGLRTVLLEGADFAQGTSSRSTKLFHGGVRYLRGGQLSLVAQSLRERETIRRNAPALVHELPFLVPAYRRGERAYYGTGLLLYEWLARAGGARHARTRFLSRDETVARMPTLRRDGLRGAAIYHDDQFDDAGFAFELARAAAARDAVVLNYHRVEGLLLHSGRVAGVSVVDEESGRSSEVPARVVINAGGARADAVRRLDDSAAPPMLRASRGSHVVVDGAFLPGDAAVMIPRTDDGRVVFLIPWRGRVLIGTTEMPCDDPAADPVPTGEEVDFLLGHAARYLTSAPTRADVRSTFAGLRPLLAGAAARTAALPRDHRVVVSARGLVTITGGKWTTYRLMAEDAVDRAAAVAGLGAARSQTARLELGRGGRNAGVIERHALDGARADAEIGEEAARLAREEMARRVEDVLARRTRSLFLDARGSAGLAGVVARALAAELGRNPEWVAREVADFEALARRYLPGPV